MKVSIAICEDVIETNAELEKMLTEVFKKLNVQCEIEPYFSGERFCKAIASGSNFNLIFLDIEYAGEEINGVGVGKLIREHYLNNSTSLVFISWKKEYSLELHDLQPINFLVKPLEVESVERVVRQHLDVSGIRSSYFSYKIGRENFRVQVRDIVYVESRDRHLILYLASGEQVTFYGALRKEYPEQLHKHDFILIHSAYAVNYDYIRAHAHEEVIMDPDGTRLTVSQNNKTSVRKEFLSITKRRRGR